MYANLAAVAVVVLVIAIWTTNREVLIAAVIVSGIFIAAGAIVAGIVILTTAHGQLTQAERVQAEQVATPASAADTTPTGALIPVRD